MAYKSGIYTATDCVGSVNHGLVAVGYGKTPAGVEFVTVRNSWGKTWGEAGYARIKITPGEAVGGVCKIYS